MAPQIYTIGAHQPFARTFIEGLRTRALLPRPTEGDSGLRIFVPHRRGQRAVHEAFHRQAEGAVSLLPQVIPLGDLAPDEDLGEDITAGSDDRFDIAQTTIIPAAQRRMQLAKMLADHLKKRGKPALFPAHLLRFSDELATFIDHWRAYGGKVEKLMALADEQQDSAEHWQTLLDYLLIAVENWPSYCRERKAIDESLHQEQSVLRLAEDIAQQKDKRFIVAGSSGTRPMVRQLMGAVLHNDGIVVLPALDTDMAERDWQTLLEGEHTYHPQFALAQLLQALGVERDAVGVWHADTDEDTIKAQRVQCVQRCFAPLAQGRDTSAPVQRGVLDGVRLIACEHEQEEARVIACLVRESIHNQQSVAVIVSSQDEARRVRAALSFWSIEADNALGVPLATTPTIVFLRLILDALIYETPASLLALMRHPCATFAGSAGATRELSRRIERSHLRRITGNVDRHGLLERIRDKDEARGKASAQAFAPCVTALDTLVGVLGGEEVSLETCLRAHIECAEALSNKAILWQQGEFSETCAHFLRKQALRHSNVFPAFRGKDYAPLFDVLLQGGQAHVPRTGAKVVLYGAWEARMQSRGRIIVMGMNEDAWPRKHRGGIWLSPEMEKKLGLPNDAQRDGLAAHDFVHVFGAEEVVLTRAKRLGGTPQVESPFITRLKTMMPAGLKLETDKDISKIAQKVDEGGHTDPQTSTPPRPAVTQDAFTRLSISDIRLLREHPYRFYAKKILRLTPLPALGRDAGAAELGSAIHELCARFFDERKDEILNDPQAWAQDFVAQGEQDIARKGYGRAFAYFYRQRLEGIAYWLMDYEQQQRNQGVKLWATEKEGTIDIDGVRVTGKADRLQVNALRKLIVLDYKTGGVPSLAQIRDQRDVQLTLEALIANRGGFEAQPSTKVTALNYIGLSGRKRRAASATVAKVVSFPDKGKDDFAALLDSCGNNVSDLIRHYRKKGAVYPAYGEDKTYKPYAETRGWQHLAREQEWSVAGDGDD